MALRINTTKSSCLSVQTPIQFFILAWLLAAVWVVPALADDKGITKVQAEGVGSWYEGDAARARDEALEAAQRTAVEQASGVIISTETQMNNFDLVKDEVLTASKGFIKSYKVVKEGRDDELYRVLIDAEVSKDDFIKGMNDSLENLYKRVGMPAVMVVVKESILGEDGQDSGGVAEKEIRKTLLMKGFKFIDYHSIQGGNQVDKAMEGAEIRKQDVIKVAKKNGANLVIFGMATTKQKGMMGQFVSTQAVVSIDVVRTDNNQAIASDTISSPGVHMDRKVSAMTAVKNAADKITPKLIEQVSYLWVKEKNEGSQLEVVVKNVSFAQLREFMKNISNGIKGVKKVSQRSYQKSTAILDVTSRGSTNDIAEAIVDLNFEGFKVEVKDVNPNRLTVSVTPR